MAKTKTDIACANCASYRDRHSDAAALAAATAAGHPVPEGLCHWEPRPVPKRPQDCCGQHSTLIVNRMQRQAELIAALLAPPAKEA